MRTVSNTPEPNRVAIAGAALAAIVLVALSKIIGFLILAFIFEVAWNFVLPHALPTIISPITYWQSFFTMLLLNVSGIAFLSPLKEINTKATLA